tara:strand:+ start:10098 stop:12137 length:2040 start_codon:yes stop_codon:yes gene_type:complete
MVASIDDSGISMDALLMEVLKSETALGKEMRDKVSATLDIATSKIEAGVGAMKFNTSPINITDLTGMSADETERNGKAFAAQQRKMLKWIKDVTLASNWKQLRKGVTINDIFVSDKVMNDRLEKEYRALQRKILKTIKSNIPTKMDALPKQAAKVMKVAPPKGDKKKEKTIPKANEKTDPSENKSSFISGILGKMGTNIKEVGEGVNDKIKDIKSEKTIPSNKKITPKDNKNITPKDNKKTTPSKNKSSFISGILGKMGTKKKATGDFNESVKYVNIGEFGKKAVEQLSKALTSKPPSMLKKPIKGKVGLVTKVLKAAGIIALLGLVTYLAKNPEKWEKVKTAFKEKVIPIFKKIPYYLELLGGTIFNMITLGIKLFKDAKTWMTEKFWPAIFSTWDWIVDKFTKFGKAIGEGAFMISAWIKENVIDKFVAFGKSVGEGAAIITTKIEEAFGKIKAFATSVWEGAKSAGASIKETILKIPDFMKDMFIKMKSAFINLLNKIPGVAIGPEAKIASLEEKINKEKERIRKSEAGENEYIGREWKGVKQSKAKLQEYESQLIEINSKAEASDTAQDFIYRPGQPIQKFSGSDVLIGAKEKLIVENKNLDKQMHDLTSVMEAIKGKFDQLISLNMEMVKRGGSNGTRPEPLPPIPTDIGTNRALAYDEALNHKTKVWELLHGV